MIDVLYVAWNRLEFTKASFDAMRRNTDWSQVSRLVVYDDGSSDGTLEFIAAQVFPAIELRRTKNIGPVAIMNHFIRGGTSDVFCKIDNDVMLPTGWLNESLEVMEREHVDLLGIEAMRAVGTGERKFEPAEFIGGIGLMRRSCFTDVLPSPNGASGRFGFGNWQEKRPEIRKGWMNPALPVCLLNRVPREPWMSLSRDYVAKGWQRDWPGLLTEDASAQWEWFA